MHFNISGYNGTNCENNINECVGVQCNHGRCRDRVGDYICVCDQGYTGRHCDTEINECEPNPCEYGGTCVNKRYGYQCYCPRGTSGNYVKS